MSKKDLAKLSLINNLLVVDPRKEVEDDLAGSLSGRLLSNNSNVLSLSSLKISSTSSFTGNGGDLLLDGRNEISGLSRGGDSDLEAFVSSLVFNELVLSSGGLEDLVVGVEEEEDVSEGSGGGSGESLKESGPDLLDSLEGLLLLGILLSEGVQVFIDSLLELGGVSLSDVGVVKLVKSGSLSSEDLLQRSEGLESLVTDESVVGDLRESGSQASKSVGGGLGSVIEGAGSEIVVPALDGGGVGLSVEEICGAGGVVSEELDEFGNLVLGDVVTLSELADLVSTSADSLRVEGLSEAEVLSEFTESGGLSDASTESRACDE